MLNSTFKFISNVRVLVEKFSHRVLSCLCTNITQLFLDISASHLNNALTSVICLLFFI